MNLSSNTTLLSITIPTWNRAKTLEKALGKLMPQLIKHGQSIELIISDNHSSDHTRSVIENVINSNTSLNIRSYYQSTNTGFYGNFKKCKELANGKYIWILSDDDFIQENVIDTILNTLSEKKELGILYLDNHEQNKSSFNVSKKYMDIDDLFNKFNYQLTLASSVIFLNEKQNDAIIFEKFKNSNLIGYALLAEVILYNRNALFISGFLLKCRMDTISGYNIFDAFIGNLSVILLRMRTNGFSTSTIKKINNAVANNILLKRYFYLKAKGKLDGGLQTYPINKVTKLIYDQFGNTWSFYFFFVPIILTPSIVLRMVFPLVESLRNFIRKK